MSESVGTAIADEYVWSLVVSVRFEPWAPHALQNPPCPTSLPQTRHSTRSRVIATAASLASVLIAAPKP